MAFADDNPKSNPMTSATDGPKTLADAIDAVEETYEFMLAYAGQGRAREETGDDGIRDYLSRAEAGLAIIAAIGLATTRVGRSIHATGSNPDAARLSGINLRRYILAAFCLMGALAGLAAILHTARVGSASPDAGNLMELDAIASCVIGGTSLMGGRGTVFGAVLGALILASLDNGMSLLNVESWAQYVVKGGVLVAAVGFDMFGRRKA